MDSSKRRAFALVIAASACPALAGAQTVGRFRFAWARDDGAELCPDGPAIAQDVVRRLGRDPFVETRAPSIEASVRRDGLRWLARLVVRDASDALIGVREFTSEAADCAAIASAVTLGVALSIDPDAALRPPPPVAPPVVAPPVVAPPVASPAAPPVTPPAPRVNTAGSDRNSSRSAIVALQAIGAVGLLPDVAFGVALAADGPIAGRFRWSAGMMLLPEPIANAAGTSFAFGITSAWVSPCVDIWRGRASSFTGCVAAYFGAIHAVVLSGDPSSPGEELWAAASAALRFRARLIGPLLLEAGLEGIVPLIRHRFYDGSTGATAFQQSPVAGVASVGVALQFR